MNQEELISLYPKISVIILNYQNYQETIRYVNDLFNQKHIDLSVVIVDNKSPNNSLKFLTSSLSNCKNVYIVDSGFNGGYAYGNNVGIKYVIKHQLSEYLIISNNDIAIDDEFTLSKLINKYEELPSDKAFASPLMLGVNGLARASARKLPTLTSEVIHSSHLLDKLSGNKPDYNIDTNLNYIKVDCLPGSFFLGTIKIFEMIDFFDESTFLYGEEKILGYKVKKIGLSNYLIPSLQFYHFYSQTIDISIDSKSQLSFKNESKLYYWNKYRDIKGWRFIFLKLFFKGIELENSLVRKLKIEYSSAKKNKINHVS